MECDSQAEPQNSLPPTRDSSRRHTRMGNLGSPKSSSSVSEPSVPPSSVSPSSPSTSTPPSYPPSYPPSVPPGSCGIGFPSMPSFGSLMRKPRTLRPAVSGGSFRSSSGSCGQGIVVSFSSSSSRSHSSSLSSSSESASSSLSSSSPMTTDSKSFSSSVSSVSRSSSFSHSSLSSSQSESSSSPSSSSSSSSSQPSSSPSPSSSIPSSSSSVPPDIWPVSAIWIDADFWPQGTDGNIIGPIHFHGAIPFSSHDADDYDIFSGSLASGEYTMDVIELRLRQVTAHLMTGFAYSFFHSDVFPMGFGCYYEEVTIPDDWPAPTGLTGYGYSFLSSESTRVWYKDF